MRKKSARKNPESRAELLGPALLIAALCAAACWPVPRGDADAVRPLAFSCMEAGGKIEAVMDSKGGHGELGACPDAVRFMTGEKMDINTAGERALMMIPGVGAASASRILELRERSGGFAVMEEVLSLPELSRTAKQGLEKWTEVK